MQMKIANVLSWLSWRRWMSCQPQMEVRGREFRPKLDMARLGRTLA